MQTGRGTQQQMNEKVQVKDYEIHFMYALPINKKTIEDYLITKKQPVLKSPYDEDHIQHNILENYYNSQLVWEEELEGYLLQIPINLTFSLYYCQLSKAGILEVTLKPRETLPITAKKPIEIDFFIAKFARAERNKDLFFKKQDLEKRSLIKSEELNPQLLVQKGSEEYYPVKLWVIAQAFCQRHPLCSKFLKQPPQKEFDINADKKTEDSQRPYPVIIIHQLEPFNELTAEEFLKQNPKVILGLLTRPSYGYAVLSKERIEQDQLEKNYFYSEMLYQQFHMRAALSLATHYTNQFPRAKGKRYKAELLNLFRLVRMIWLESHVLLSSRLNMEEERDNKKNSNQNELNETLQFLYRINFQYLAKGSKVYLTMFEDSVKEFGIQKRLEEMAEKIDASRKRKYEEIRSQRLRQLTLTLSFFGAILSTSKFIEWLYQTLITLLPSRVAVWSVLITTILAIGLTALIITRVIIKLTKKVKRKRN
ncbi:MAG: hypothetical protein K9W42_10340 [Candidatus Heimdallarchaeota archaeon]|nr:hypothetical protein [Candidatus Heimdallarchaeota archaeon]